MKRKIKIDFVDFWPGFIKTDNYFYNLLKEEFDVEITSNPDYLFFSVFGNSSQFYNCTKIFFTGEDRVPHFLIVIGHFRLKEQRVIIIDCLSICYTMGIMNWLIKKLMSQW